MFYNGKILTPAQSAIIEMLQRDAGNKIIQTVDRKRTRYALHHCENGTFAGYEWPDPRTVRSLLKSGLLFKRRVDGLIILELEPPKGERVEVGERCQSE